MAKKTYLVLQNITRRSDGKLFTPGQEVELDLTRREEKALLAKHVIEPVKEKPDKKKTEEETKDG